MANRRVIFLAALFAALAYAAPATAGPAALIAPVALGVGGAFLGGGGIMSALALTGLSMAGSFVSSALMKGRGGGGMSSAGMGEPEKYYRVTIDNKFTIKQSVEPRRIIYGRTRVGGVYGFMHMTDINQTLWTTILFAGHQIANIAHVIFDDEVLDWNGAAGVITVASGRYAGVATLENQYGLADQTMAGLFLNNLPLIGDKVDTSFRGQGIAYLACRLHWETRQEHGDVGQKIWQGGLPNITAVIDGKHVWDPRSNSFKYTPNAALVIADYLCDSIYGMGCDFNTDINIPALIAAANICDEIVPYYGDIPVHRYTINGSFDADSIPEEVLGKMAAAMHGKVIYENGQWTILPGVYYNPEIVLTDDDMIETSTLATLTSARDSVTSVKGKIQSDRTLLMPDVDFPAVTSDAFAAVDNGWFREKDIELPFTTNTNTAQRIAKIDLLRGRQELVETFIGRPLCWWCRVGDVIFRNSARYGWSFKPFEVTSVRFVSRTASSGQGTILAVELTLAETIWTIYDWSISEEAFVDPAPNTLFPNPFVVSPPGPITAFEELYVSRQGGGVKSMLKVSWGRSPDAFTREYALQYSIAGLEQWITRAWTEQLYDEIVDLAPGEYDLRVFARNWSYVTSPPSTKRISVYGVIAPPSDVQNLTATTMGGFVFLRWDRSIDLDVLEGGSVIVRHSSSFAAPLWAEATTLSKPLPGNETSIAVPARAGTYMVKFRDGGGNYSVNAAVVLGFQNSVLEFAALDAVVEDPAFAGTLTNMQVVGSVLQLTPPPGINIDDVPDIDALTSFDNFAVGFPPGEYLFAQIIDLGTATRCRLTAVMASLVFGTGDLIDARSNPIDEWATIDGDVTGDEADGEIWVSWTNDDPVGAPVWSAYQRLDQAEFDNRAFRFKLIATRDDESVLIEFSELAVFAEAIV